MYEFDQAQERVLSQEEEIALKNKKLQEEYELRKAQGLKEQMMAEHEKKKRLEKIAAEKAQKVIA